MRKRRHEFELASSPEQKDKVVNAILEGHKGIGKRCRAFVDALLGCDVGEPFEGLIHVWPLWNCCRIVFSLHKEVFLNALNVHLAGFPGDTPNCAVLVGHTSSYCTHSVTHKAKCNDTLPSDTLTHTVTLYVSFIQVYTVLLLFFSGNLLVASFWLSTDRKTCLNSM